MFALLKELINQYIQLKRTSKLWSLIINIDSIRGSARDALSDIRTRINFTKKVIKQTKNPIWLKQLTYELISLEAIKKLVEPKYE